jgi:hypothetical protein
MYCLQTISSKYTILILYLSHFSFVNICIIMGEREKRMRGMYRKNVNFIYWCS